VSRDFRPLVFHQTTPSGPLIHGLKFKKKQFEFAEIFDYEIAKFVVSGVNDTTDKIFLL
jgi:hypothetical protein